MGNTRREKKIESVSVKLDFFDIYPRELPLGSQSHSRISSLCVRLCILTVCEYEYVNMARFDWREALNT